MPKEKDPNCRPKASVDCIEEAGLVGSWTGRSAAGSLPQTVEGAACSTLGGREVEVGAAVGTWAANGMPSAERGVATDVS